MTGLLHIPVAQTWQVATRRQQAGSHSTPLYYLRTANRAGALPDEKNWVIGFRVALDLNSSATTTTDEDVKVYPDDQHSMPKPNVPITKSDVKSWPRWSPEPIAPIQRRYVNIPPSGSGNFSRLPFARHNHEPTIASCPNGQLYASWFQQTAVNQGDALGLFMQLSNASPIQSGRQLRLS